jgi:hypothetical protein
LQLRKSKSRPRSAKPQSRANSNAAAFHRKGTPFNAMLEAAMGGVIEDVVIVGPALRQLAADHDKGVRTVGCIDPFAALL